MRVLFVSSHNSNRGLSPIVKNQADSLANSGCTIEFYGIVGKGMRGYLSNISALRRKLYEGKYDVVHAHYSFSGIISALAGAKPLVVSLMGSDIKSGFFGKVLVYFFKIFFWNAIIVKSTDSKNALNIEGLHVIPNGVNFHRFYPRDKTECMNELSWDLKRRYILFAANPARKEKNFKLAEEAFSLLDQNLFKLVYLRDVPNEKIPVYLNAADVVILCSLWEGSPNVIKESLACNRPIVSTDCGDVKELISDINGCFVSGFNADEFSNFILQASKYKHTLSRDRIGLLDSRVISKRIISIYNRLKN